MINENGQATTIMIYCLTLVCDRRKLMATSKKELLEILVDRNKQVFTKPLTVQKSKHHTKFAIKKNYTLKCAGPLCSKDKCKNRSLGIGLSTT